MQQDLQSASLSDRLLAWPQLLLPTRWLSSLMCALTRWRWQPFKNAFIRIFMRMYRIDLDEALIREATAFESFNAFFTRALLPESRPIDANPSSVVPPVDGCISQLGVISQRTILQAKGISYTVDDLLAGLGDARALDNGTFCTIYLAPNNYHRIHMPMDGLLHEWNYVPGRLFSVNPATARTLPGLFARNERVGAWFDTPAGPFAMILVGALFVGSMETVWAGQISPPHRRDGGSRHRPSPAVALTRGQEMGRFNMGSTVILLGAPGLLSLDPTKAAGEALRMGQAIGTLRPRSG